MTTFLLGTFFGAALLRLAMFLFEVDEDHKRIQFLIDITKDGCAPAILFDDDGNWAVSFDGWQVGDQITNVIEPDSWKPSLREAIDAARQEFGDDL